MSSELERVQVAGLLDALMQALSKVPPQDRGSVVFTLPVSWVRGLVRPGEPPPGWPEISPHGHELFGRPVIADPTADRARISYQVRPGPPGWSVPAERVVIGRPRMWERVMRWLIESVPRGRR